MCFALFVQIIYLLARVEVTLKVFFSLRRFFKLVSIHYLVKISKQGNGNAVNVP